MKSIAEYQSLWCPENKIVKVAVLLILSLIVSSCGGEEQKRGGWPVQSVVYQTRPQTVVDQVRIVGSLVANEAIDVQTEIDGRIDKIAFNEGQEVEAGALLVTVNAEKLQSEVARAEANFKLAEANLKRSKTLLNQRTISPQEYDQTLSRYEADKAELERVMQLLDDASLEAPFAGIVGSRLVSPGQYVSTGQKITSLVSIEPIKLEMQVPERYISQLKSGLKLALSVQAFSEEKFEAEVYFIASQVDPDTRTALVKARAPNQDRKLLPGMFAEVSLVFAEREQAIVVPESGLMMEGDTIQVFTVTREGKAEMKTITIGTILEGRVEVRSGLQLGDVVVTQGIQKLRPGSTVIPSPDSDLVDESYFQPKA